MREFVFDINFKKCFAAKNNYDAQNNTPIAELNFELFSILCF